MKWEAHAVERSKWNNTLKRCSRQAVGETRERWMRVNDGPTWVSVP